MRSSHRRVGMNCPRCTTPVREHLERCHVCGYDIGFPNVRAAEQPNEVNALASRVQDANTNAAARKSGHVLYKFGLAVSKSDAVLARSLGTLDSFTKSDNELYVSYH